MEQWTHEQAVNFEVAKEFIGYMVAIQSNEIWKEKNKENPNQIKIESLELKRTKYLNELSDIKLTDFEKIKYIKKTYGQIIKKDRENS
jgi:hypothetical protein